MCGIIGISAENNVAEEIYESLLMLQHRGGKMQPEWLFVNLAVNLIVENQRAMSEMSFSKTI